nr:MAG: hypothetical protein [Jingmen bat rhabdovirus 2]
MKNSEEITSKNCSTIRPNYYPILEEEIIETPSEPTVELLQVLTTTARPNKSSVRSFHGFPEQLECYKETGFEIEGILRLSRSALPSISVGMVKRIILGCLVEMPYPLYAKVAALIGVADTLTHVTLSESKTRVFQIHGLMTADFFPTHTNLTNSEERVTAAIPTKSGTHIIAHLRLRTRRAPLTNGMIPPVDSVEKLIRHNSLLYDAGFIISWDLGRFSYALQSEKIDVGQIARVLQGGN